jgi:CRP-like cAMP-binding protein
MPENYDKKFGEFSEIITLKKNQAILKEGKVENYIYFNIKGAVVMILNNNGKEVCANFSLENSYFSSYASFLTRKASKYSIIAAEETIIERVNYQTIQKAYELSPDHQKNGRLIAESLFIEESNRTLSLITTTAKQRYLNLMKNKPEVLHRIPLKYLSSYLGITPVSLSRLRSEIVKT